MFIASCPECGDSLTFPGGVALSSRCRCPLCTETFTLEECLSELPPMAEVLDGEVGGSGFSPAYGASGTALATAPRMATAASPRAGSATAPSRAGGGRAPARKSKGGNPILQMAQIVVGGAVGVGLAVLIIWWGLGKDPFNLAPTVAQYAPFLVPAKFQAAELPFSSTEPKTAAGEQTGSDRAEPLQKNARGGVKLDSSRFGLDDEQPQPGAGRGSRSSLDPDAGELSEEPVVDTLMPDLGGGGAFGGSGALSAVEEPSLDSFALPDTDLAPASDPTADAPDAFAPEPLAEEPMVDAPEGGEFNLEPFAPEPQVSDAEAAERLLSDLKPAPLSVTTVDPFELVFPTATEDLTDVAAAEAEAWEAYSASKSEPGAVRRELGQKHYDQLAELAQLIAGLPPAPESNAAVAELTARIANRFAAPEDRQVANFLARTRLTDPDFGLAGVVVVGRVEKVAPEAGLAVVTLTLEQGANEQTKRVLVVVRESQGLPEEGSAVVTLGVRYAGAAEALPASLAEEKAPIILAGAVAPVGADPAVETPSGEEPPAAEPASSVPPQPEAPPTDPAPTEPAPTEPSTEEPSSDEPTPSEPAPTEEPGADPAPEESEPEGSAPAEEGSDEEPAPAAPGAES